MRGLGIGDWGLGIGDWFGWLAVQTWVMGAGWAVFFGVSSP
jgi:hypothetical protein